MGHTSAGANQVNWDGTDANSTVIAEGSYDARITLRVGEYHFISSDAETSGGSTSAANPTEGYGLTVYSSDTSGLLSDTYVYWDDITVIGSAAGGTSNTPFGALSSTPEGRHTWGNFSGSGLGNERYIDTYVYGLDSEAIIQIEITNDDTPIVGQNGTINIESESIPTGTPLITVVDSDINIEPNVINTIVVDVENDQTNEIESVTLVETGLNTGEFSATINLQKGSSGPNGDGTLLVVEGNTITVTYFDQLDSTSDSNDRTSSSLILGDLDGDGIADVDDPDDDNDGISDAIEGSSDTDGDLSSDRVDLDSDNDGITDAIEGTLDTDADSLPNYIDTDSDADGISDSVEGIIDTDTDSIADYLDIDSDGDGLADSIEGSIDTDNDGTTNFRDLDSDNDTILDSVEGNTDTDSDTIANYIDTDSDGDGIDDSLELVDDPDADGLPNYIDSDSDGDGINDESEGDSDSDNDGISDYLDNENDLGTELTDSDNDGISDLDEGTDDRDADGIPNNLDIDSDNDSIDDGTNDFLDLDSDNDSIFDVIESNHDDANSDGRIDRLETDQGEGLASTTGTAPVDTDNDGVVDFRDLDSDNDSIPDVVESFGFDRDNNATIDGFTDLNSSGLW